MDSRTSAQKQHLDWVSESSEQDIIMIDAKTLAAGDESEMPLPAQVSEDHVIFSKGFVTSITEMITLLTKRIDQLQFQLESEAQPTKHEPAKLTDDIFAPPESAGRPKRRKNKPTHANQFKVNISSLQLSHA
jgi:hypothetical protein